MAFLYSDFVCNTLEMAVSEGQTCFEPKVDAHRHALDHPIQLKSRARAILASKYIAIAKNAVCSNHKVPIATLL